MHYEFCGELGVKRIYQSEFQYQPRFALFEAIGGEKRISDEPIGRNPSIAVKKERVGGGMEEETLPIPTDIRLKKITDATGTLTMINEALGGDTADMFGDFFSLPFSMANVILKEIINVIPNLVGKIGKGVLKIATLGAVDVGEPKLKIFNTQEDAMKLKKLLNNVMGAKVYLSIGPREHDKNPETGKYNSFFSKMEHHEEVIFKETPSNKPHVSENEAKAGRKYKE